VTPTIQGQKMKLKIELKVTKAQARRFIENMERQGYVAVTQDEFTHFTLDGEVSANYEVYIPGPDYRRRAIVAVRPE
jgi:DNA-binding IclR family transcriptional regulator